MTTAETPFVLGKAQLMWESGHAPEVAIFATGPLLHNALAAAKDMDTATPATVTNVHTIKPLDKEAIVAAARAAGAVVVVEEHQVAGGLGSAIAELLAAECPAPMEFIGVHDRFGQSGEPKELLEYYEMGVKHIIAAAKKAASRKR
jgi:transketolase